MQPPERLVHFRAWPSCLAAAFGGRTPDLQHTFDASGEAVVNIWVENPYWQYFCGETYLQTGAPIDPSSLTRWRKRIGKEGVETLLTATIEAARRGSVVKASSVQRVNLRLILAALWLYCVQFWLSLAAALARFSRQLRSLWTITA